MTGGPELKDHHYPDGQKDHPRQTRQPIAGIDGEQSEQGTDAHLCPQQLWLQHISAQRCGGVEHHQPQAQVKIPGDQPEQAPGQQYGSCAEQGQGVQYGDHQRRKQRKRYPQNPQSAQQNQKCNAHEDQLCPHPAAQYGFHAGPQLPAMAQQLGRKMLPADGPQPRQFSCGKIAGEHRG